MANGNMGPTAIDAVLAALERLVSGLRRRPEDAERAAAECQARETEAGARRDAEVRAAVASMKLGKRSVSDLTEADVRGLLTKEAKRPATARYRFGALSRFLDWCRDEGLIALNPCLAIGENHRPRPVKPRTHHLSLPQLATLWRAAADAADDPNGTDSSAVHRDYAWFLLAVPARRLEVSQVEWQHLDLKAGAWTMPDKLTNNGDPFRVPLPGIALYVLRERRRALGEPVAGLVFPYPKAGKAITTFSAMKLAMDKASSLTAWRWHDFRQSFVTVLAEHGVAEAVADAMLNHRQAATRGGVLGVYQLAARWPEQVAAMEGWGAILAAALEGKVPGNADVLPRWRRA
jgi:integrase